jgi:hypothetical protein
MVPTKQIKKKKTQEGTKSGKSKAKKMIRWIINIYFILNGLNPFICYHSLL